MIALSVNLSPELARFITEAVENGTWANTDELFAYALGLARTAAVLGKPPVQNPSPAAPQPTVPLMPAPPDLRKTPASGVPVVDLTRQTFDSSSFMGELTRKLHGDKK